MASDPLFTVDEMQDWTPGRTIAPDDSFALVLIAATSLVIRDAGDSAWTAATVPERAKLIAILLARDYYVNPDQLISETTGPLTERRVESVVRQITLNEEEKDILAKLASKPLPSKGQLFTITMVRGAALEEPAYHVTDSSGTDWEIPWLNPEDHGGPLP